MSTIHQPLYPTKQEFSTWEISKEKRRRLVWSSSWASQVFSQNYGSTSQFKSLDWAEFHVVFQIGLRDAGISLTKAMDAVGCDWLLSDLGPPPDAILRIPPPPLPHFIDRIYLHEMAAAAAGVADSDRENETALPCHWCHWARRLDAVGSISVTSGTEMALEDTWFFVILASCLMLTLGALLSGLIYLRLKGKTLKEAWDFGSFLTENGSILIGNNGISGSPTGTERNNSSAVLPARTGSLADDSKADCPESCSPSDSLRGHLFHNCSGDSAVPQRQVTTPTSSFPPLTRALWAGVKTSEGNHYTITHAQPFDQKLQRTTPMVIQNSQQPDEDSAGYTTLHPSATTASGVGNKIYYCCTDLMIIQQSSTNSLQQVTSLDDPAEHSLGANPLYVNMSALHPLSTPKLSYPLVNPIYPSPYRLQEHRNQIVTDASTIKDSVPQLILNNPATVRQHNTHQQA